MRPFVSFVCHTLIVVALTLLTQIGVLAYVVALLATRRWRRGVSLSWRAAYLTTASLLIYAATSIAIVPPLAGLLGRERAPCASTTSVGCALNRAYLKPKTLALI